MPKKVNGNAKQNFYCDRPQIKPLQITNWNKFPGIPGEDCALLRVFTVFFLP